MSIFMILLWHGAWLQAEISLQLLEAQTCLLHAAYPRQKSIGDKSSIYQLGPFVMGVNMHLAGLCSKHLIQRITSQKIMMRDGTWIIIC